jgi:hypothetical protein
MESKGIQWYNQQTSTQEMNDGIPQEISIPPVSWSGPQVRFQWLNSMVYGRYNYSLWGL